MLTFAIQSSVKQVHCASLKVLVRTPLGVSSFYNSRRSLQTTSESNPKYAYLERLTSPSPDAGITFLNLNRPEKKNALSMQMLQEIEEAVEEVRFDQYAVSRLKTVKLIH
jgi:hypothetical protein